MENEIWLGNNSISGNGESTASPTTESSDEDLSPIGSTEDVYNYIHNSMPKFGPYPVNYGNASGLHDTIKDIEKSKNAQQVQDEQVEDGIDMISGNKESTSFPTTERSDTDLTAIWEIENIRSYITGSMPKYGLHPMSMMETFGNASGHKKEKKARKVKDAIFKAEEVDGHRGDIIHDVDKLLQFINGKEEKEKGAKPKKQRNVPKGKGKQHKI